MGEKRHEHERIVCAANQLPNGTFVMGIRHFCTVMNDNAKRMNIHPETYRKSKQGFVTNRYRWVSRGDAFVLATKAGQILEKTGNPNDLDLYSEDLY